MRSVRWRFLLVAVALPAVGLFGLAVWMGHIHGARLEADLDARLLAQAAVEAESLFDGEEIPHLHTPDEPGDEALVAAISVRAIYRPDGSLFLHQPRGVVVPDRLVWKGPTDVDDPWLETVLGGAVGDTGPNPGTDDERRVVMRIRDPLGGSWILWLAAPLGPMQEAITEFHRTALGLAGGMVLLLALLAYPLSRRVVRGVEKLVSETLPHLVEPGPEPLQRVRARDEIEVLHNAIADAAERLKLASDARGRVLAHAAHELRTPLSLMRTEIDLALRRERSAAELRDALTGVRAEVDRLSALATGLLDLERLRCPTAFAPRPTDLGALVEEAVARFRAGAPDVVVEARAPSGVVVALDEQMVRMAVDNLVGNAVKHSPKGATVAVEVERVGDRVRVAVEDEGPGVPEEERARIFEPFYRAPGAPQGTGLGLAIVGEIAALHRGSIAIASGHKGGARFVLELAA